MELSIVTPVYNGAETIGRMMASLERIGPEHRVSAEAVFIDDGSTDDTCERIGRFVPRLEPMEILLLRRPKEGVSAARNAGIERARGAWILFVDADDELLLDPFPFLHAHSSCTSVGFSVNRVRGGKVLRRIKPERITEANRMDVLTAGNPIRNSGLAFKRECIEAGFDPEIPFGEDWLFWCRNPRIFSRMAVEEEKISAAIHIHGANTSADVVKAGYWREKIALLLLDRFSTVLTKKQRNNLTLQAAIGRLQQRLDVNPGALFPFPCDGLLYAKFLVYSAASRLGLRATPYGVGKG